MKNKLKKNTADTTLELNHKWASRSLRSSLDCLPGLSISGRMVAGLLVAAFSVPAFAGDFEQSLAPPLQPEDDGWEFSLQLDGYAPWVEIDTPGGNEVDLGLDKIVDSLQMVVPFTIGVRKGKWGLRSQVIYVDLAGDASGSVVDEVELKEWFVSPVISYRAWEGEKGFFEVVAGARYTWVELSVKGKLPVTGRSFSEDRSGHIWDGLVGVNGAYNINEKWSIPFYGEVGAGDSDFISQGWAGVSYQINPCSELGLLFRVVYYDFGDSAPLDTEFVYGPHLYYRYTF